jgi:hypothetical protein
VKPVASPMQRVAGYSESLELTQLIEQLRERLGTEYSPAPTLVQQLDEVLSQLVVRNQRLRVLYRLARKGDMDDEHMGAIRSNLEQLDAQLLQQLPQLLERLNTTH